MDLLPISVCLISNSDPRLAMALDSVKDWVTEIIVVLNDDTDAATEQLALDRGAKVFRETWAGHIRQKNSAMEKAGQPWILALDSDEAVSAELRGNIKKLFATPEQAERCAAWCFPRLNDYCGRWIHHGEWYPDLKTRLWQRHRAVWGGDDPHDKLEIDGPVGRLNGDLLHYSHEGFAQTWLKAQKYAETFARIREQRGKKVSLPDLLLRPLWRFVRAYFFHRGFLDGWRGYSIACMTAAYTFLRYAMAYERQRQPEQRYWRQPKVMDSENSRERLPITACAISNSDPRLAMALDSVKDWVTEIIVVLNDDTDAATEQLALDHGAKVFREKWKGQIGQKQSLVAKAGQPWILMLDSDEAVSDELRESIRKLFAEPKKLCHYSAWHFSRLTEYCGKWIRHGEWYPDQKTRLWQRGKAVVGGEAPHDKLLVDGPTGRLRGDLLHRSQESFAQMWMKAHRYAEDFAATRAKEGKKTTLLDLCIRPPWRFFRSYVLLRGFLDGWRGYCIACMTAAYTYLRYGMAYEHYGRPVSPDNGRKTVP